MAAPGAHLLMVMLVVSLLAALVHGLTDWSYSNPDKCGALRYDTSSTRRWRWDDTQLWDDVTSACPRGFASTRMSGIDVWAGNYLHGIEATYDVDGVEHLGGLHAAPVRSGGTARPSVRTGRTRCAASSRAGRWRACRTA